MQKVYIEIHTGNITRELCSKYIPWSSDIHTYIIGHYNPLVRITAYLVRPLMLRTLILYMSGATYMFILSVSNNENNFKVPFS